MGTLEEFIEEFKKQFDSIDGTEDFSAESQYREINGWDSLTSIMVLGMIEEIHEVALNSDEFLATNTIKELFDFIQSRNTNIAR